MRRRESKRLKSSARNWLGHRPWTYFITTTLEKRYWNSDLKKLIASAFRELKIVEYFWSKEHTKKDIPHVHAIAISPYDRLTIQKGLRRLGNTQIERFEQDRRAYEYLVKDLNNKSNQYGGKIMLGGALEEF